MRRLIFLVIAFLSLGDMLHAAQITNVVVRQVDDWVVFEFDITGPEENVGVTITITIEGRTYGHDELHLEGDLGTVSVGEGRRIIWEVLKDFPEGYEEEAMQWEIKAGPTTEMSEDQKRRLEESKRGEKSVRGAIARSILPGWGQFYVGSYSGAVYALASLIIITNGADSFGTGKVDDPLIGVPIIASISAIDAAIRVKEYNEKLEKSLNVGFQKNGERTLVTLVYRF